MLVEHARNVMGIEAASHAEYGGPGVPVVSLLSCSLVDSEMSGDRLPGLENIEINERSPPVSSNRAGKKVCCFYVVSATYRSARSTEIVRYSIVTY